MKYEEEEDVRNGYKNEYLAIFMMSEWERKDK